MKIVLILFLSIFLFGCGTTKFQKEPTITTKPINIDSEALTYCNLLNEDIKIISFEDAIVVYSGVVAAYSICANKQATSVKLLKFIGNKK